MSALAYSAVAFLVLGTVAPYVRRDEWWVRIFDFPRPQILVLSLVTAAALVATDRATGAAGVASIAALACVCAVQARHIYPYTPFARVEAKRAPSDDPEVALSLLTANVLMSSRDSARLLSIIRRCDPDLVLALEPDSWWESELDGLAYPYVVSHPLDNRYGISLRSKLPLVEPEIKYLVNEEIPSIHTEISLPGGSVVSFHGLHPAPPAPTEADDATERDAELLIVGRAVRDHEGASIVTGDLNDVAWSHTTNLFRRTSGLLDPRRGRGMYNSFHAWIPFLRFPLDHVFYSSEFLLVALERMPAFGSDHFPIYCALAFTPRAPEVQPTPDPKPDDGGEVRAKIECGEPLDREVPGV